MFDQQSKNLFLKRGLCIVQTTYCFLKDDWKIRIQVSNFLICFHLKTPKQHHMNPYKPVFNPKNSIKSLKKNIKNKQLKILLIMIYFFLYITWFEDNLTFIKLPCKRNPINTMVTTFLLAKILLFDHFLYL
jgi:hypothetical protein